MAWRGDVVSRDASFCRTLSPFATLKPHRPQPFPIQLFTASKHIEDQLDEGWGRYLEILEGRRKVVAHAKLFLMGEPFLLLPSFSR